MTKTYADLDLTRTKAALAVYDANEPQRLKALRNVSCDGDYTALVAMEKAAELKVKEAYYTDTADRNSRTTIVEHMSIHAIRRMVESLG